MRVLRYFQLGALIVMVGVLAGCAMFDAPPTANFSWSPTDPLSRTDVQFTDLSTDTGGLFGGGGIATWSWDFGDNDSSPSQNPKHEYESAGSYTVKLTVTDTAGNTAAIQKTVNVIPSLDGRWLGTIWDAVRTAWQLEFQLQHSATGGITGTAYVSRLACNIISASFTAATGQVRISFAYTGTGNIWLLIGNYNASIDYISGYWENTTLAPGVRMGDWEVYLR